MTYADVMDMSMGRILWLCDRLDDERKRESAAIKKASK